MASLEKAITDKLKTDFSDLSGRIYFEDAPTDKAMPFIVIQQTADNASDTTGGESLRNVTYTVYLVARDDTLVSLRSRLADHFRSISYTIAVDGHNFLAVYYESEITTKADNSESRPVWQTEVTLRFLLQRTAIP